MELSGLTFCGPELVEDSSLSELPSGYADLLRQINGFVAFDGGFHLRGVCDTPKWHSLAEAWRGTAAVHRLFPAVQESDLPFAQDCMGDQFILRDAVVHKLYAETGDLESMELSFREFFGHLTTDPLDFLQLQPLVQFQRDGGQLRPGELLAAYPPFSTEESANGVLLRAIPAAERIASLADMARQLSTLKPGEKLRIVVTE